MKMRREIPGSAGSAKYKGIQARKLASWIAIRVDFILAEDLFSKPTTRLKILQHIFQRLAVLCESESRMDSRIQILSSDIDSLNTR